MALGTVGKYEKLDVLGHGTSGIVYLAWDRLLGKHVALKEISIPSSEDARFLEEARVLDRLRHPNIVQVNGVDRIDGHLFIDMEYVKGTNLLEYMRTNGRLSPREAIGIVVQVCDALEYAHRNHTIHRDIKPANILITREGTAKIADFGLAEILGSGSYAGGAGTYAYMAPEDFEEEQRSDHRSDIWSVGITLYETLTGRRPFQASKAKDPFAWRRAVSEDAIPALSEVDSSVSGELMQVISRALAKDKYDRYQSIGAMRDELAVVLRRLGGSVPLSGNVPSKAPSVTSAPARTPDEELTVARAPESRISALPASLDFESVRKGETETQRLVVDLPGRGSVNGRVVSQPGWLSVTPQGFRKRRQTLSVVADTATIWECGSYSDKLTLDMDGETVTVPVRMEVQPARRRFKQVFWWYLPLVAGSLMPILTAGLGRTTSLGPAELLSTCILSVMLLVICYVSDLGVFEKLVPAMVVFLAAGGLVGVSRSAGAHGDLLNARMWLPGAMLGFVVVLQLLTSAKWRFWAVGMAVASILVTIFLSGG